MSPNVLMNGRVLSVQSNGQRRFATDMAKHLNLPHIGPQASQASGIRGHLWEQLALPVRAGGRPLWSPSTSGPVIYRKQVVTIHDLGFVDAPQYFSTSFAAAYTRIVALLSRSVRHIVTVSEFSRRRIIEEYRVPEDKVTTVHCAANEAFYPRPLSEQQAVRRKFGVEGVPYLIGMAVNDPRKNTAKLVEAWASLGAARRDARLILFGRRANTRVFASGGLMNAEGEGIVLAGEVGDDDLAALYSATSGLVFPSIYEGFGLPIVEAASCGAPVIAGAVTSMPEVSPRSAILVDPTRVEMIADAMLEALRSEPTDQQRGELVTEMMRFNWENVRTSYHRIFAEAFE